MGTTVKRTLQNQLTNLINENASQKELVSLVKDFVTKYQLAEAEVSVLLWNTLMGAVEWSKKEELVADQSLKHLKNYTNLMAEFTKSSKSELALMIRIQEYCYDNMNFLKVFQKIIVLYYKGESVNY